MAFTEKIYNWQYLDPYGRYFDGVASKRRLILAIVSREGKAKGYALSGDSETMQVRWIKSDQVAVNDKVYDLTFHPPGPLD